MTDISDSQSLADFLSRHVKPYDPVTDDYDRPPFAADIKEGKNDPIYNAHSYHTKVPPRSIIPYILHYTKPGDLILDPFCGSGMTGVAAQMCANPPEDLLDKFLEFKDRVGSRVCILNDLSPAACHIAYNYNTPVDVEALKREFERIKAEVKEEFHWLYGTEHYAPSMGLYDSVNPEVASRLKNLPPKTGSNTLFGDEERNWELLTVAQVEERLGYPVTELPREKDWGDLEVAKVKHWISIPATIQYTVWSDVYRCEGFVTIEEPTGKVSTRGKNAGKPMVRNRRVARGCGNTFDLWSTALDRKTGEVADMFPCPFCSHQWKKTQLKRQLQRVVLVCFEHKAFGANGHTRSLRKERNVTAIELERIREIQAKEIPYWVPDVPWDKSWPQYRRNALGGRGISTSADFYTRRNLWGLACLIAHIRRCPDARVAAALLFNFTSIFRFVDKRAVYSPNGLAAVTGTLYFPSLSVEHNIWKLFDTKMTRTERAFQRLVAPQQNHVICGSATSTIKIANASIDYIFTDPPFGSNIYYSEMNLPWEGWLGRITDQQFEAVVHRKQDGGNKRLDDYRRLMALALKEMFRVLKPGRWATVEFNNSDGAVFEAIKLGIRDAGFEIANMLLLDKEKKTFKQIKGAEGVEDVVDKDVLFNLHKPAVARDEDSAEDHDLEHQVADAVRQHLQTLPERVKSDPDRYSDEHRTTATINSMLMNVLIPRGISVERLNLPFIEHVCAHYFRKVGNHWYLRGEAVGSNGLSSGQAGGDLLQEEVTIKDELTAIAWLRQKLELRPMLIGELKPLWMRATGLLPAAVSQPLVLDYLLTENYWRDPDTNRWREPNSEEREWMNDDRSLRVLHDAERYLAGVLTRQTTDDERCKWIDVLYLACRDIEEKQAEALPALRGFNADEAYRVITRLFQSVLKDHVATNVFRRAEKQVSAASNRIATQVEKEREAQKAEKKNAQQTLDLGI